MLLIFTHLRCYNKYMHITKIQFVDHTVFGNLEIDFRKKDGTIADTIIFAGENGTGKTTLLDEIANIGLFEINCNIFCSLDEVDARFIRSHEQEQNTSFYSNLTDQGIIDTVGIISIQPVSDAGMKIVLNNGTQNTIYKSVLDAQRHPVYALFRNLFFKYHDTQAAPDNEKVTEISNDTRLDLIEAKEYGLSSTIYSKNSNYSKLLIDINSQDANEIQDIYNKSADGRIDDSLLTHRIERFKHAFNAFFDNGLSFEGVLNFNIFFKKYNNVIDNTSLSFGEKQIIQNGAFFLKDKGATNTSFISLIDEPERSLHPKWEEKILDYYKTILKNNDKQTSQLFVTTHSEYVIQDAYNANDLIIILKRDSNGKLFAEKDFSLDTFSYSPSYNEIKYKAFGLATNDFHNELFGYIHCKLQQNNSLRDHKITTLDSYLHSQNNCPIIPAEYTNIRNDLSLPVYIRNYIDHPGEEQNGIINRTKPTTEDLEKSINYMISFIKNNNL